MWGRLFVIDFVWGCGGLVSVGDVGAFKNVVVIVVINEVDVRWGYGVGGAHKRG